MVHYFWCTNTIMKCWNSRSSKSMALLPQMMALSSSVHIKTGAPRSFRRNKSNSLSVCPYLVRTCGHSCQHQVPLPCCVLECPDLWFEGADDDGSGSTTILESYRALLAADFRPVRNVEFQWYSAEVLVELHHLQQKKLIWYIGSRSFGLPSYR
jgi:hypothetical protein